MGRDAHYFERVWERRDNEGDTVYRPGRNLRVDKACELLHPGKRFLDVGCGLGVLGDLARDRYEELYGVDISEFAVRSAAEKGILSKVVNLNQESLPYEDGFFDTVAALSTLQFVYDVTFVLGECHRVLRPRGEFLLTLPNMRTFWRIFKLTFLGQFPPTSLCRLGYDGGTLHYFCYKNMRGLLEENGFRVVYAHGIFCRPRFLKRLADDGVLGWLKREFFSAEVFIKALKQ